MSTYVPPSREVDAEAIKRLGETQRYLRVAAARVEDLDHVSQELVVAVDLLLDRLQAGLDGFDELSQGDRALDDGVCELPDARAALEARLELVETAKQVSQLVRHVRSLTDGALAVKPGAHA